MTIVKGMQKETHLKKLIQFTNTNRYVLNIYIVKNFGLFPFLHFLSLCQMAKYENGLYSVMCSLGVPYKQESKLHFLLCSLPSYPQHTFPFICHWLHDKRSAPQDQIFFLLNDGFIRQISCSPDSEPSVIEIYPCVNSTASQSASRAMEGCHSGLLSKYEWEMSADLGDLPLCSPALTFPSERPAFCVWLDQRSPQWELLFFF